MLISNRGRGWFPAPISHERQRDMARMPLQVHIYLYRKNKHDQYEYALFQRSENSLWWQGVSGGVEDGETPVAAALREMGEEAGVMEEVPLYPLESISYLPVFLFDDEVQRAWGREKIVIPMYFFAAPYGGEIRISSEHTAFKWLTFEKAYDLVYFHDQKTALWELKERLNRGLILAL